MISYVCTWWGTLLAGFVGLLGALVCLALAVIVGVALAKWVIGPLMEKSTAKMERDQWGDLVFFSRLSDKLRVFETAAAIVLGTMLALVIVWGIGLQIVEKLCGGG